MTRCEVKILGAGKYLPTKIVESTEIAKQIGRSAEWVEKKSGVVKRHVVTDETNSFMGAMAAQEALNRAELSVKDIDAIVYASATSEQVIPCTAALIHRKLGLEGSGIPAFDVNATCLSFLVALDLVAGQIQLGKYQRVLVISSEIASKGLNPNDPESYILFGDGAAAVVVGKSGESDLSVMLTSRIETYSEGSEDCKIAGGGLALYPTEYHKDNHDQYLFSMNGKKVFKLASSLLPGIVNKTLKSSGLTMEDIQAVIPHQASAMAMRLIMKKLDIDERKWINIIKHHGNVIAASIPIALHEAITTGCVKRGDLIMLLGTSAGMSLGCTVLRY